MSSTLPILPMGTAATPASRAFSDRACVISVSIKPGATALTHTPRDANSLATLLVSPMSPALEAL